MLVGINLLREGLDIPEVSLVAILDADKEGYLRSSRSLIQTIGRAARNVRGKAILYADRITESMRHAMGETERRRRKQVVYNEERRISPKSIVKPVKDIIDGVQPRAYAPRTKRPARPMTLAAAEQAVEYDGMAPEALGRVLRRLEKNMYEHAKNLEFEEAALLRDKIQAIRTRQFGVVEGSGGKQGSFGDR